MTTPLQAARHRRGWSQTRAVWELGRLADRKGVRVAAPASLKTLLSRWENGHATPDTFYQPLLCELYRAIPKELGFGTQHLPVGDAYQHDASAELIAKATWTRDDISALSESFDDALGRSVVADIELLAHEWLSADKPQLIELGTGRRVGDSLVSTVEHRVKQLRRADDFVSGRALHVLVRNELRATTRLLDDGALTEDQSRRLLTATGELAQLAAWVAADAGLYREAALDHKWSKQLIMNAGTTGTGHTIRSCHPLSPRCRLKPRLKPTVPDDQAPTWRLLPPPETSASYAQGGVLAAHAADDQPLAANIISTLSYQLANTGNPREAALLARTAYAGARQSATATTKALLLERVAWGDAKSGDLASCQRSLGLVEEHFSHARPEDDPDWVYWLNREEIDVMAGRCYTELKQPKLAEPLLQQATAHYDHSLIREDSLYLSWLAEDYILLNEIERASEIATQVLNLATRANSARTDERLRHLVRLLRRNKEVQAACDFIELYRDTVR